MILKELTREDCEHARAWRNGSLETLRTPYPLTEEMQSDFYDTIVCNRASCHRYYGAHDLNNVLVGIGGITNIQWENSIGEISLILDQDKRGNGLGAKAVDLLLDKAFNQIGLRTVFGECYCCNIDGVKFWTKVKDKYKGLSVMLPSRKFWNGSYYSSLYFSIDAKDFQSCT